MLSHRYGALALVEAPREQWYVQSRLKRMDRRLFVELQLDLDQRQVWVVNLDEGLGEMPQPLLEWRDPQGNPIPQLTERLIDEVQRLMSSEVDVRALVAHNEAIRERRRQDYEAQRAELVHEHVTALESKSFGPVSGKLNHERHRQREARLRATESV